MPRGRLSIAEKWQKLEQIEEVDCEESTFEEMNDEGSEMHPHSPKVFQPFAQDSEMHLHSPEVFQPSAQDSEMHPHSPEVFQPSPPDFFTNNSFDNSPNHSHNNSFSNDSIPPPPKIITNTNLDVVQMASQNYEQRVQKWIYYQRILGILYTSLLMILKLASGGVKDLPKSEKTWRSYDQKYLKEQQLKEVVSPELPGEYVVTTGGHESKFRVKIYSIWSFIKKAFEKPNHARILSNWREHQSKKGVFKDIQVGTFSIYKYL
jgi:hypothetical protein